jgi:CRISPR-associated endonuclease/helicase Cas3
MNVLLVSQCDKRALTETRRILDQFAERRGSRTWQTPITQAGLDTLRRLLRKTARKNTAVACHWIRGRDHSELLWIVGDASRFNAEGAVPTDTTVRDILRRKDENDWHRLEDIHLLSAMAALLHDLGKACAAFQQRLKNHSLGRNQYRHEWISLRMFQAFVGPDASDEAWLRRLIDPTPADDARWTNRLQRDGLDPACDAPLAVLPPLARAIAWLVVTHHRLPVKPADSDVERGAWLGARLKAFNPAQLDDLFAKIHSGWNEDPGTPEAESVRPYWTFPDKPADLPVTTPAWRRRAARIATRLLKLTARSDHADWLLDPHVMHLSRLCLMLADHHYSSLTDRRERLRIRSETPLFANTDRRTGKVNQPLDEHLLGVEAQSGLITHGLPHVAANLPRLARHKGLRKRSADERFRWQDRAADAISALRHRTQQQGAFIVNMASTGCGKTLANARIMYALNDPNQGFRCAFALGLRTLTLQTGRVYQKALSLNDDELAIRVGGAASRQLFEHHQAQAEATGSASTLSLLEEDGHVYFEGNDQDPLLQRVLKDPQSRSLLAAPMLVCTVDHLVPATESQRGGHQIAPMLRLMSGDLVLDELDDFDIDDLPALTRLVFWAGLLGSRVLLSSATLPPAIVRGMFEAYRAGREHHQRNRGERPGESVDICCAWIDEFDQHLQDCADSEMLADAHDRFVQRRARRLGAATVRRRGELVALSLAGLRKSEMRTAFAERARQCAIELHRRHHSIDPLTDKRVSFGLVRMANIGPLFDVALTLLRLGMPEGLRLHLCVYHSQFPLLLRSAIEARLDRALDRRDPEAVFEQADIRHALDTSPEPDQLFVVLGSPVTEVGRDHDYDWAVVEPSSMRSLIQLAGRVRRHRPDACDEPNLAIFDHNLRCFENPGKAAYCRPGFERDEAPFKLSSHDLHDLLDEDEWRVIDARPRIAPRPAGTLRPDERLSDLEHQRLAGALLPQASAQPLSARERRAGSKPGRAFNAASCWQEPRLMLTGVLAQQQPFRYEPRQPLDLVLLPDEDGDEYSLYQVGRNGRDDKTRIDGKHHRIDDAQLRGTRTGIWGRTDFMTALEEHAALFERERVDCAWRFATVSLPPSTNGWRFHPALGFTQAD